MFMFLPQTDRFLPSRQSYQSIVLSSRFAWLVFFWVCSIVWCSVNKFNYEDSHVDSINVSLSPSFSSGRDIAITTRVGSFESNFVADVFQSHCDVAKSPVDRQRIHTQKINPCENTADF